MQQTIAEQQLKQYSINQLIAELCITAQHNTIAELPENAQHLIAKQSVNYLYKNLHSLHLCAPKLYRLLLLINEFNKRRHRDQLDQQPIFSSPDCVTNYLKAELSHRRNEVFWCLFLDNKHQLIHSSPLFEGTIDCAGIYPREVVLAALQVNAAAVIFAHNHPSGQIEPSAADRAITEKLSGALALIDIRVLDHVVVAGTNTTSFAQRGWV